MRRGVLSEVREGKYRVFTVDYAFDNPSAAASVVFGGPASGPREWKVKGENQTYGEWQAKQFDPSPRNEIEPTKKGDGMSLEDRVARLEEKVKELEQAIQNSVEARGRTFEMLDKRVKENSEAIDELRRN